MRDIDIADLVSWALVDQNAGYFCEMPGEHRRALMSSTAIVTNTLALGVQVDCQPGFLKRMGARCHPDAIEVYHQIDCLPDRERLLVMGYGRTRSAPDWDIWPEIRPMRHPRNGRPIVESEVDAKGRVVSLWCPLDIFPSLDLVAETRKTYQHWRNGLAMLVSSRLRFCLSDFRVTGPAAPVEPWA